MNAFHLLVALFAAYMLVRHGRRALVFVAPGLVRVEGDPARGPCSTQQLRAEEELQGLGFVRLGARRERSPLGGLDLPSEAYANVAAGSWADVFDHAPRRSGGPLVYFLSRFPGGATVLTANHPRLAVAGDAVQTGGLPGSGIAETFAAHLEAVKRFAARHGAPAAPADLGARGEAARAWYRGPGRREIRRLFALNFVNALVALLLIAGSVRGLVGLVESR